ncbi:MAG: FAD-dependent oxidoreductase [Myxococcota bacterium]
MSDLDPTRSESVFEDFKPAYTKVQAEAEANRCLFCEDAPCIKACPTSIDIPQFIRKIATGNIEGSARTIFSSNILGMSCARVCPVEVLCVGDCVFNVMDQPPIQIGKLQRYSTDLAYEAKWAFFEAGTESGKSVGIVGAGPAALATAHELRRLGNGVTLYEKRDVIGGLNSTGVAPYKMKADASFEEAAWVLEIGGIEVKTGVEIGKDITFEELETKHDALVLAFGLGPDSYLKVKGEDLEGVYGAVDYIERFKLGKVDLSEVKKAVVVGGGNTALDAVRELKGLGVPEVTLAYRGQEEGMSGYAHEWKAGKVEGIRAAWGTQPTGFVGNGKVSGVECIRLDASKKPIDGSEHVLDADLVLLAIGQGKLGELVSSMDGISVEWGCIVVDEHGATGRPGVYAAGDAANGGTEVVYAAAEGKAAAHAIDAYLKGE